MSKEEKNKHILILGGMGPQASVYAHSLVVQTAIQKGAVDNEDFPRITHLSVNVKDFISNPEQRQEACNYLVRCLKEVDCASVDVAFIACNTAHLLREELESATGLQFMSLIGSTIEALKAMPSIERVGILATPSTLSTGIYNRRLSEAVELLLPREASSRILEEIIRGVIGGGDERALAQRLKQQIDELVAMGAQKVVLGCTELSLLGSYLDKRIIIDPLALTVEKILSNE